MKLCVLTVVLLATALADEDLQASSSRGYNSYGSRGYGRSYNTPSYSYNSYRRPSYGYGQSRGNTYGYRGNSYGYHGNSYGSRGNSYGYQSNSYGNQGYGYQPTYGYQSQNYGYQQNGYGQQSGGYAQQAPHQGGSEGGLIQGPGNKFMYYSWRDDPQGKYTWDAADQNCKARGMSLVIMDPATNDQVFAAIAKEGVKYIWTSGRRTGSGFAWADGKSANDGPWSHTGGKGQPQPDNNEGQEDCIAVLNDFYQDGVKWHDVACHHEKPYVCETYN